MATMHGVARVMVKGHADERNKELRKKMPRTANADPHAHKNLMRDLAQWGMADASHTGPSPDGPQRLH